MNRIGVYAAFVLALLITSCGEKKTSEDSVATVRLDTVQVANADAMLQFPGRVVSSKDANLSFKTSGTIARIYVDEGSRVQTGQLLAEMDAKDYKVQLSATEAEYARVKAEAERVIALYKEGAATASDYDKARFGLQQMEAKLKNHHDQVAYCKLYAPFSGAIQRRLFFEGENVSAGMPVLMLVSLSKPEIEINLPATTYMRRSAFTGYSAQFDVLPGEVVPLKFLNVAPKANANQLYTMRLTIEGDAKGVAPGMSAWVSIMSKNGSEASEVRVPTTAIVEDKGESHVYLYDSKSQTVRRSQVKMIRLHTDGTAVVSGSLLPGNIVVSTGVNHIKSGDKVTPLPPISETNIGGLL
ncbi:MAG: efflux RND transporter periplasmic adaptor subunit [Bacteroidaceae bacterium]|nr:efflux RND transporter periplasmic adaptor subunit [Bacteroidaceae bacterium]